MRGRRIFVVLVVLIFGVLVLAGCRPQLELDLSGRQSEIDAVAVTATLAPDGVVHVEARYRFAADGGGTVAFPKDLVNESIAPEAIAAVGGIRNVTVGASRSPRRRAPSNRSSVCAPSAPPSRTTRWAPRIATPTSPSCGSMCCRHPRTPPARIPTST